MSRRGSADAFIDAAARPRRRPRRVVAPIGGDEFNRPSLTGSELRAIREALGVSTAEFGRALGSQAKDDKSAQVYVRRFESMGRSIPEGIARLALMFEAHGIPANYLIH